MAVRAGNEGFQSLRDLVGIVSGRGMKSNTISADRRRHGGLAPAASCRDRVPLSSGTCFLICKMGHVRLHKLMQARACQGGSTVGMCQEPNTAMNSLHPHGSLKQCLVAPLLMWKLGTGRVSNFPSALQLVSGRVRAAERFWPGPLATLTCATLFDCKQNSRGT